MNATALEISKPKFPIVEARLVTLDESMADELLKINTYEGQRAIDGPRGRRRMDNLVNKLCDGRYTSAKLVVARCKWNGTRVLINGQTSAAAIKFLNSQRLKGSAPITVPALLEELEASTPDELALAYGQQDAPESSRNQKELNKTTRARFNLTWRDRSLDLVIDAEVYLRFGSRPGIGGDQRAFVLSSTDLPAGGFVDKVLFDRGDTKEPRFLMKKTVVAAMLQTFNRSAVDAEEFWTHVRDGENLQAGYGDYKLREYLLSYDEETKNLKNTRHSLDKKTYVKSLHGWNAFRSGEKTNLRYYENAPIPNIL